MYGILPDFQYLYVSKDKIRIHPMEAFIIRAYGRTELAQCYFPTLNPQVAHRKLQSWIDYYPHLRERLQAAGCNPHARVYMPVHVRMIVEAIGEP